VIVAMGAMPVMEAAINQIIDVIAMRHRFMAAADAMDMSHVMTGGWRGASIGIGGADLDDVLIHVIGVGMMQMPVMQIIDVSVVPHGGVAAASSVLVIVMRMNFAVAHKNVVLKGSAQIRFEPRHLQAPFLKWGSTIIRTKTYVKVRPCKP
jgi:hypothetical protein